MAGIADIIGAGRSAGYAAAGSVARNVRQLDGGNTMQTPQPAAAQGSAALAAGMIAFAAVGVLVTMRVIFRGAVS